VSYLTPNLVLRLCERAVELLLVHWGENVDEDNQTEEQEMKLDLLKMVEILKKKG